MSEGPGLACLRQRVGLRAALRLFWCCTGDWGELQGADAAAMVEVVEHLDLGALLAAGPALLGGLRPRIAVVTTPNIEYNPVRLCRS